MSDATPRPTAHYLGAYREQLITAGIPEHEADRIVFDLAARLHEANDVCIPYKFEAEAFMNGILDGLTNTECSPKSSAG